MRPTRERAGSVRRKAPRADQRNRARRERRRTAADALADGREPSMAETDREATRRRSKRFSAAREATARAEERMEGRQAPARRHRAGNPRHARGRSARPRPALAETRARRELPPVGRDRGASSEKLRRDRERLGAVNLRAEEELREVETQHAALTTERDDLVEAIKRLRQGIQSLNREARERPTDLVRGRQRPLQAAVHRTVRRRRSRAAPDRERRSARGRPRNHRQATGQEAAVRCRCSRAASRR